VTLCGKAVHLTTKGHKGLHEVTRRTLAITTKQQKQKIQNIHYLYFNIIFVHFFVIRNVYGKTI
jgi:hypothetical protein